ncbi:unnamed protein product [Urochloa decumbens]|uniref:KIB1-4 beta-propeller domain-containing protein n=1 Tax=Urochloa decumbens TaxID=240449 RepID=A0ABC8YTS0_9POAL
MEQDQRRRRLSWPDSPPEVLGQWASSSAASRRWPTATVLAAGRRYRFGAICRSWHAAERQLPRRRQLPWLALSLPSSPTADRASFYSLSDEAVYRLPLPAGAGGVCAALAGSADDWLVVAHRDRGNFLVNLFTGATLPLPHQRTITRALTMGVVRREDNQVVEYYPPRSQRKPFIRKAVLSCAPSAGDPGRCIVAAVADSGELFFCRPGQGSWRRPVKAAHDKFQDITFYNGKLYGMLWSRWLTSPPTMQVFDLDEDTDQLVESSDDEGIVDIYPEVEYQPQPFSLYRQYCVESRGRLLMVGRYCWNYMDGTVGRTCSFKVYHREPVQPEGCPSPFDAWVALESLDGEVLFVGGSGARSFAAAEHGVDSDCIYFADDHCQEEGDTVPIISCPSPDDPAETRPCRDIGKYCMRDGSVMYLKDLPYNERRSPPVWLYLSDQRR